MLLRALQGPPGLTEEAEIPKFMSKEDPTKPLDTSKPCLTGWRNIIVNEGPEAFAKAVRAYPGCVRPTFSPQASSLSWH